MISLISMWHAGGEAPFKAGERAWPGAPIAELPDASSLRISARVDETERGRLALNEAVTLQLDAIADRQFTGKIEHIGTIATSDFSAGWPIPRNFDLEIAFDQTDPRLKPGMTAQITVMVDRVPDAHHHSRAGFVSQIGTDRGLRLERLKVSGARHSRWNVRSRDRILVANGLKRGRPRGAERSHGEGVNCAQMKRRRVIALGSVGRDSGGRGIAVVAAAQPSRAFPRATDEIPLAR